MKKLKFFIFQVVQVLGKHQINVPAKKNQGPAEVNVPAKTHQGPVEVNVPAKKHQGPAEIYDEDWILMSELPDFADILQY